MALSVPVERWVLKDSTRSSTGRRNCSQTSSASPSGGEGTVSGAPEGTPESSGSSGTAVEVVTMWPGSSTHGASSGSWSRRNRSARTARDEHGRAGAHEGLASLHRAPCRCRSLDSPTCLVADVVTPPRGVGGGVGVV